MYAITGQNWRDFVGREQVSFLLSDFHIPGSGLSELIFSGSGNIASFTFEDGRVYDPESRYIGSYNYNTPFALSGNIDSHYYQYYYDKDFTNEPMTSPWGEKLGANTTAKTPWPIQRIFLNAYEAGSTRLGNANAANVNSGTLQIGFNPPASYSYHFPSTGLPLGSEPFEIRGYFTGYLRNDDDPNSFVTMRDVSVIGGDDSGKFVVSSFDENPITGGGSGEIIVRHITDSAGLHNLQLGASTNLHEMTNGVIGSDVIDLQNLWGEQGPISKNLTLVRMFDDAPESGWLWGGQATGYSGVPGWDSTNVEPMYGLADSGDNSKVDRYRCYSAVMETASADMLDRPLSVLLEYHSGEVGQFEIITGISHSSGSGYLTNPVVTAVGGYNASNIITTAQSVIETDTGAFNAGQGWFSVASVNINKNNTSYPSGAPDVIFTENVNDTLYPVTKLKAAGTALMDSNDEITGVQMISGGTYQLAPTVQFSGLDPDGDGSIAQVGDFVSGKILSEINLISHGIYFSGNNVLDYGLAKSSYGISQALPEVSIGEGGGGISGVRDSGHFSFSGYQKTFTGQFNLWTGDRYAPYINPFVPPNMGPISEEANYGPGIDWGPFFTPDLGQLLDHRRYGYGINLPEQGGGTIYAQDPWQPPYNVGYLRSGISYQVQEPTGSGYLTQPSGYIIIPDDAIDETFIRVNVQFDNTYDSLPLVARLVAVGSEDGATRSGLLYETGQVETYHNAKELFLTGAPSGGTPIF